MALKRAIFRLLIYAAVALVSGEVWAQHYQPFGPVDHNPSVQWFAPVNDFLLEQNPSANEGYFFSYERMNWTVQKPDRSPIGDDSSVISTIPSTTAIFLTPDQQNVTVAAAGGALNVPQFNTITIAVPHSESGWGNRYELGYMVEDQGWIVGILGGLKQHFEAVYGADDQRLGMLASAEGLDGEDGIQFDSPLAGQIDPPPAPPGVAPIAPTPGFNAISPFDGFREVSVVFADPLGLRDGFVDLNLDTFADDLNFNGIFGNDGADTVGDGVPDTPAPIDFGDLTRLATIFDVLEVRDQVNINGVELMKMKRMLPTHRAANIELFYGVRYLEVDNRFQVIGRGGVLADSQWHNRALNRVVGPQIGFRHYHRRRRWTFDVEGRFMAGANFLSIEQNGVFGTEVLAGAPDNPFFMGPTTFANKLTREKFTPVGELRVETAFNLTRAIALQVGWTGLVAGNVARASDTILYRVPSLGIINHDEDIFTQGVNFGVEINR